MPRVIKIDNAEFVGTDKQIKQLLKRLIGDGSAVVKITNARFEYKESDDGCDKDSPSLA